MPLVVSRVVGMHSTLLLPQLFRRTSLVARAVKNLTAMQEICVKSLGWEDPLAEDTPLQYSCREDPMDRGAWWATVHRVTKSWT